MLCDGTCCACRWNNISASFADNAGKQFEWWSVQKGPEWDGTHSPFRLPHVPVLHRKHFSSKKRAAAAVDGTADNPGIDEEAAAVGAGLRGGGGDAAAAQPQVSRSRRAEDQVGGMTVQHFLSV